MLEVAKPPAGVALLAAAAVGASPRVDGLRASPAVVGVLAPLGPRAPAHDEPLTVVVSAHASTLVRIVAAISRGENRVKVSKT